MGDEDLRVGGHLDGQVFTRRTAQAGRAATHPDDQRVGLQVDRRDRAPAKKPGTRGRMPEQSPGDVVHRRGGIGGVDRPACCQKLARGHLGKGDGGLRTVNALRKDAVGGDCQGEALADRPLQSKRRALDRDGDRAGRLIDGGGPAETGEGLTGCGGARPTARGGGPGLRLRDQTQRQGAQQDGQHQSSHGSHARPPSLGVGRDYPQGLSVRGDRPITPEVTKPSSARTARRPGDAASGSATADRSGCASDRRGGGRRRDRSCERPRAAARQYR